MERQMGEGLQLILAEGVCDGICGLILAMIDQGRDAAALSYCCVQIHAAVVGNLEPLDAELRVRKARRQHAASELQLSSLTGSEVPDRNVVIDADLDCVKPHHVM